MTQFKTRLLGVCVAVTATAAAARAETRDIDSVPAPDKATPLAAWTPAQQYASRWSNGKGPIAWGYAGNFGMLVFADEIGDKLAELGRATLIDQCFNTGNEDTRSALSWAICGSDVKALDMTKLEAELDAEQISESSKRAVLQYVKSSYDRAAKIGEVVEAAAKNDPGVAQVLALADQAKAEWKKYLGAHREDFERYLTLKDAVRSGMSNHKSFAGCWEATQPAFAKLVKATKFPWEVDGDYLPAYVGAMLTSTANYITTASFAACAYSIDASGEALAAAALAQDHAGTIRVGWRTIALAKALDPTFKPRFANRSLSWGFAMLQFWQSPSVRYGMRGLNSTLSITTPVQGTLKNVKKAGDVTKLAFAGDKVESCLRWKATHKVLSIGANGDPIYERVCLKRGLVENQEPDVEIATKFAAGAKRGTNIWLVAKFPVCVWKGKKFIAVLGQPK